MLASQILKVAIVNFLQTGGAQINVSISSPLSLFMGANKRVDAAECVGTSLQLLVFRHHSHILPLAVASVMSNLTSKTDSGKEAESAFLLDGDWAHLSITQHQWRLSRGTMPFMAPCFHW